MPFSAALSTAAKIDRALEEVCTHSRSALPGKPDLAFAFFSPHHAAAAERIAAAVAERLAPRCLLGCVAEAVIGGDREMEEGPALSLWLGRWPGGVALEPFHAVLERTSEGPSLLGLPDGLVGAAAASAVLLLGDPYTFPVDLFLHQMNENNPGLPVLGGMASGMRGPGECRLLFNGEVRTHGAVGVLLQGDSACGRSCRRAAGRSADTWSSPAPRTTSFWSWAAGRRLQQLQELWQSLAPQDQNLFQQGLHIGRVINEYRGDFQRGDFLVRNVLGLDRDSGALAITERVRVGQTVQFHVRDAATADEDLHALLQLDMQCPREAAGGGAAVQLQRPRRPAVRPAQPRRRAPCGPRPAQSRWPASSPRANSARSAARTSCTASRPAWPCSRNDVVSGRRQPDRGSEPAVVVVAVVAEALDGGGAEQGGAEQPLDRRQHLA